MSKLKVGINGFGRIGRAFTRIALDRGDFEIAVINTRKTENTMMAYLLKHDSVYRAYHKNVVATESGLEVDGVKIATTHADEPNEIPWGSFGVDIVVDATGAFLTRADLEKHLGDSVKHVVLTAPAKDESVPHLVLGVNDDKIDFHKETVISNASCTTNCAAPMFKVLNDAFGVETGFLTTAHAYTLTQSLLDDANKEFDRSRAAALNLAPSTTGAAKAIVKTIPELTGKIDGMAIRVPVPTVSFSDISAVVSKKVTIEEVNAAFQKAAQAEMKGYLDVANEVLVSSDYIGSPYSCTFDKTYTKVIGGNLVKVFGWYDNEWGYSCRLVDLISKFK